jgi:membrane fusion protein, copper/silver efflux system
MRKVVIVKEANGYRPVEIKTGEAFNDNTEILNGLTLGEEVVVSGQFLIDSEASLSGVLARLSQQDEQMDTEMNDMQMQNDKGITSEKMPKGLGKVVALDIKTNHITLNHEPITELGWPSMTMGFKVKDSKQLNNLKVGDEVEFDLIAESAKDPEMPVQYMIDRLEKSKLMSDGMTGVKP